MTSYLDGELARRDRDRLEAHLAECPHCAEYLRQLRATVEALGSASPEDLSEEALDELVGLYQRWMAG